MSVNTDKMLADIERYRTGAERLRGDDASVWGGQMRLFAEKVADVVGAAHGVSASEFANRDDFLKRLLEMRAIDEIQFRDLDKLRWVGNKYVHGEDEKVSDHAKAQAWGAFSSLNENPYWLRPVGRSEFDAERFFEAVESLAPIVSKVAKGAVKVAGAVAVVGIAGAWLNAHLEYTNTPEYKEKKAREERERERQRIQNAKDFKAFMSFVGIALVVIVMIGAIFSALA